MFVQVAPLSILHADGSRLQQALRRRICHPLCKAIVNKAPSQLKVGRRDYFLDPKKKSNVFDIRQPRTRSVPSRTTVHHEMTPIRSDNSLNHPRAVDRIRKRCAMRQRTAQATSNIVISLARVLPRGLLLVTANLNVFPEEHVKIDAKPVETDYGVVRRESAGKSQLESENWPRQNVKSLKSQRLVIPIASVR
jgi:hypothetical protein